jgi:hypothetical protein
MAELKKGQVFNEEDFLKIAEEDFTSHYQSLTPWVNRLRRKIFPNGKK